MQCSVAALTRGAFRGVTENISRCGVLVHVTSNAMLPGPGEPVTVDVNLPAMRTFTPRCLRCRGTILRVIGDGLAIEVNQMAFRNVQSGESRIVAGRCLRED